MRKHFFNLSRKIGPIPKIPLLFLALAGWVCFLCLQNCASEYESEPAEHRLATDLSLEWHRLLLELERHTPGYRPPVSARTFAYIEMAAYEATLPVTGDFISLEDYFPGYSSPRLPAKLEQFYLPASLNAAYGQIMRYFFRNTPKKWREKIDQLEERFTAEFKKQIGEQRCSTASEFGRAVAENVWRWSATDTIGHNSFLNNFNQDYIPPSCIGCWQPDKSHPMPALLPEWGRVRKFVIENGDVAFTSPATFDETPGSPFFTEAMEVFSVSQPLSKENIWIAELWSDDLPGLTVTPSGRWISIANQAIAQSRPSFYVVMETYLKTSMALCDASIIIWEGKYKFNLERPEAYIDRNIKPGWKALHDNPSFPSYPSGHSAFGAAAAEVLSVELGRNVQITDRTHEYRQEFVGKPRTYQSFSEMAQENAASRVLIGVHYRMDCEEGLRLGKIIGRKVADLPLRRKEAAMLNSK